MRLLPLLFILLLLSTMLGGGGAVYQTDQQSNFVSISHTPDNAKINQSVIFEVIIDTGLSVNNLTLDLIIKGNTISLLMNKITPQTYRYNFSFDEPGKVQYQIRLYVNDNLHETSNSHTLNIVGTDNKVPIKLEFGKEENLRKGEYLLSTPGEELKLSLSLSKSLRLMISIQNQSQFDPPSGTVALSNLFDVRTNDTSAIHNAQISLKYNTTIVDNLGINPEMLILQYRHSNQVIWNSIQSIYDEINKTVTANTTHFSQWIVTAIEPKLQFVDTTSNLDWSVDEYLDIVTNIKNFGSYIAENVTIRLILPPNIWLNNRSNTINIGTLSALEQTTIIWNILVDKAGEYNLVIIVESSNSDGDLIEIKLNIVINDTQSTSKSTNTTESPILNYSHVIIVMLLTIIYYRKKSR